MAYFESFYVRKEDGEGATVYQIKTIDIGEVESWEIGDDNHTEVFMKSGDYFILHIDYRSFSSIMINSEDVYGRLLVDYSKN